MILFSGLVFGLIVGALCKGNFFRLSTLKGLWFAILPLALNPILRFYPGISFWPKAFVISGIYLFILLFVYSNKEYKVSSIFLGLGTLSNFIVIAANNFRMPVSIKALTVFNVTAESVYLKRPDYFVAENGANLLFLGDIIYFPVPKFNGFISVGDIILAIGMFLLIVTVMTKKSAGQEEPNEDNETNPSKA